MNSDGRRFRPSFLPIFFTVLGIVFAIAVIYRIRSYSAREATGDISGPEGTTSPVTAASASQRGMVGSQLPGDDRIIGVAPNATSTVYRRPVADKERERIRRELLSAPLSASATTPQPKPKSAAVVPPAQAAAPAPRPQAPQVAAARPGSQRIAPNMTGTGLSQSASSASESRREPERTITKPKEKDPTSDNTAPQIISVEFTPPQVRDGEETQLVVNAMDDISGVRNISGSIASPSGGLQGFALIREAETTRWISRITVPKDAAEGLWRIQFLSLTDNASNTVSLAQQQGALPPTASFRVVSSRPDAAGPTLKAVWLDRPAMGAGEKNVIFVQAEDDKSGVNLVSGVFQSPSKRARIGFGCRLGANGAWECDLSPSGCIDCGLWQLEQVQMQDKANNMTTVRGDNPLIAGVKVNISGDKCDSMSPVMEAVVLDQTTVSNMETSVITVTATVSDDLCGVSSVSGQAANIESPAQTRVYFSFQNAGDPHTFVGRITIPKFAAKGIWNISWVQLLDKGHNLKTYSSGEPVLQGAAFRVE